MHVASMYPKEMRPFSPVVGLSFLPIVECTVSRYDNLSGVLSRERDRMHGVTSFASP
jgi:hypothetical protein